jgi:hypothetical protein
MTAEQFCQRCGACCAAYLVSFYWKQAHDLPETITERLTPWHSCMADTNSQGPRCIALQGRVGQHVACTVYAQRPSPCREVQVGDEKCNAARAQYGLAPAHAGSGASCAST